MQYAPVIVHAFVARFAVRFARKRDVATIGKKREKFVARGFVLYRVERPRPQPGAVERNQIHQRVAGMNRWQSLLDAQPRNARVHIFRPLRWRRFNFVRGVRRCGFQFRAMHFRLPLQVRIFVHLIRPNRCVQFEPAGDGNDFLAVRHAFCSNDAGHGHAFGAPNVCVGQFCAAARAGLVIRVPCFAILGKAVEVSAPLFIFAGHGTRNTRHD